MIIEINLIVIYKGTYQNRSILTLRHIMKKLMVNNVAVMGSNVSWLLLPMHPQYDETIYNFIPNPQFYG